MDNGLKISTSKARRFKGPSFNLSGLVVSGWLHFWFWLLLRNLLLEVRGSAQSFLHFQIVAGPGIERRLEVPAPISTSTLLIGRTREVAIFIDSTDVSRRHAEIFVGADGSYYIHDLGSRNGTLVNGQYATLSAPLPLMAGNSIVVGGTQLIFEGIFGAVPTEPKQPVVVPPLPVMPAVALSILLPVTLTHAYLVLRSQGQRFLLEDEEITVGRTAINQIVIDAKSISRQHARLQRTVAGYIVSDLGSTNKTFVNNQPVDAPVLLRDRDLVRFGEVETTFLLESQRLTQEYAGSDDDDLEVTNHDGTNVMDYRTHLEVPAEEQGSPALPRRRNLEHGETRLDLDMRDVRSEVRGLRSEGGSPNPTPFPTLFPVSNTNPLTLLVRLERVFKEGGVKPPLRNIELTLMQGEIVALYGLAGSGHHTLLNIVAASEAADRGIVQILGRILPTLESSGKRRLNLEDDKELVRWRTTNLSFLPANPTFNNRQTAFDNLASLLPTDVRDPARREQTWERFRSFNLTNSELERLRPADLTSGDRQKLALARAIINNPSLLVLTEPSQNLSSNETALLFDQLKRLTQMGKTILLATQDQFWLRSADRRYEMANGEIINS